MDRKATSTHIQPSQVPIEPPAVGTRLRLPHPLDFDWRFTEQTTSTLWRLARELANPQDGTALLGVPSLAERAAESRVWDGQILFLDKNMPRISRLMTSLELRQFDILRDSPPAVNAGLVFADPPWYEAESLGFLWCASAICRLGAYVAMSIPPVETRPGILEERARIERVAKTFGLRLSHVIPSFLRYETPFFEANAMRVARTPMPLEWRTGDLALYVREIGALGARPALPVEEIWTEKTIGHSRIRLRVGNSSAPGSPILRPLVLGDVLPTVSRRDPRRDQANVWTSGNRIFRCTGPQMLLRILDAAIDRSDPAKTIAQDLGRSLSQLERFRIRMALFQLLNVVKCESDELRAHADALHANRKLGPRSYPAVALKRAG